MLDIFCILISPASSPASKHDTAAHEAFRQNFSTDMFPFLLKAIERNVEWSKAAWKCVLTFMKASPALLASHKDAIHNLILKKVSGCLSSELLELIASCFVELPNISRVNSNLYSEKWISLYSALLNTLQQLLNPFIAFITKDLNNQAFVIDDGPLFVFNEGDKKKDDAVTSYLKGASRYINLSKCLSKMLSSRSQHEVEVPLFKTLNTITQLFEIKGFKDVITLECPSALVWNNIGEGKNLVLNGSPLDMLHCAPSSLPMPQRPFNAQIRAELRQAEEQIRQRGRAAEVRWSCDKWQQTALGSTIQQVLNALDALDRHNFDRVDSNNSLDSLYAKVFPSMANKEKCSSYNSLSEILVQDEAIVRLLCEWAVTTKRCGEHRALVVAKLLEKRQTDLTTEHENFDIFLEFGISRIWNIIEEQILGHKMDTDDFYSDN